MLAITHLLSETSTSFHSELRKKQHEVDTLHANLRTSSSQLGDARRQLETLQGAAKAQSLARQKISNLSRGCGEEQKRIMQLEQLYGRLDSSSFWEKDLDTALEHAGGGQANMGLLPSSAVLRARIQSLGNRTDVMRKSVGSLKGRSKDVEMKYRRVVALCTGVPESEVDVVVDGLVRAVESEKGELEIGRVRRFLGGVDGVQ